MLDKEKPIVYVGSDHAGYQMKNDLKAHLESREDLDVVDLGTFSEASFDYPDISREVGEKVLETEGAKGVLICGTGIGISIAANKLKGIRAANCTSPEMAEMARRHNDANIVAMGSRITDLETAKKIVDKFLETDFEGDQEGGERHQRRVDKIESCGTGKTE